MDYKVLASYIEDENTEIITVYGSSWDIIHMHRANMQGAIKTLKEVFKDKDSYIALYKEIAEHLKAPIEEKELCSVWDKETYRDKGMALRLVFTAPVHTPYNIPELFIKKYAND